jgi:RNA polymerase sigma-70 factor (ECF subfamily)
VTRELVERAQRGDREAYEQLAREAASRLHLIALRILRNSDDAEDAVQQTLVSIWRDLRSLRDPDRFEAWTYRILVRHCRAESRRLRRMNVTVVDLSESMAVSSDSSSEVASRDEIGRAFERLTTEHRTVLTLHLMVGLPLQQIADILDIPYGTVGSRLHNAKRALRAALESPSHQRAAAEGQVA